MIGQFHNFEKNPPSAKERDLCVHRSSLRRGPFLYSSRSRYRWSSHLLAVWGVEANLNLMARPCLPLRHAHHRFPPTALMISTLNYWRYSTEHNLVCCPPCRPTNQPTGTAANLSICNCDFRHHRKQQRRHEHKIYLSSTPNLPITSTCQFFTSINQITESWPCLKQESNNKTTTISPIGHPYYAWICVFPCHVRT